MICEWVQSAISATGVSAKPMDRDSVRALAQTLYDRFVDPALEQQNRLLWEILKDASSGRRLDGWSLMCEHAPVEPVLLFSDVDQWYGYTFATGDDVRKVMAECPGFEFYITNQAADELLCHNHHDFIIGVGESSNWINNLTGE